MKIHLIRHGKTAGNERKCYIGRTDEPLSIAGREEVEAGIAAGRYPHADVVIHTGMKRTRESTAIIYGRDCRMVEEKRLRECDFGIFEGRNYKELSGNPYYQQWIDSNGTLPFPQGESMEAFQQRCLEGFLFCIARYREWENLAFCVHGGTIMAILHQLAEDAATHKGTKTYYDYHCENAECLSYEVKEWYRKEGFSAELPLLSFFTKS